MEAESSLLTEHAQCPTCGELLWARRFKRAADGTVVYGSCGCCRAYFSSSAFELDSFNDATKIGPLVAFTPALRVVECVPDVQIEGGRQVCSGCGHTLPPNLQRYSITTTIAVEVEFVGIGGSISTRVTVTQYGDLSEPVANLRARIHCDTPPTVVRSIALKSLFPHGYTLVENG